MVTISVALATAIIHLVQSELGESVVAMLYMMVVVSAASYGGLGPAIWASGLSFACWNFFFVLPYGTFYVSEVRALTPLVLYLIVAGVCGHMASQARTPATEAQARERETRALYELSLEITRSADLDHILQVLRKRILDVCQVSICEFFTGQDLPSEPGRLALETGTSNLEQDAWCTA